jgi:DnaJ-class molecular chaperone
MSDVVDCIMCNGTGIDNASWDGRCPFCRGRGCVDAVDYPNDEDPPPTSQS